MTVMIALFGLSLAGIPFLTIMGVGPWGPWPWPCSSP